MDAVTGIVVYDTLLRVYDVIDIILIVVVGINLYLCYECLRLLQVSKLQNRHQILSLL